jgi:hypothetical protein
MSGLEIGLFGKKYNFRIEIVVIIVIVGTYFVINTFCSCSDIGGILEGLTSGSSIDMSGGNVVIPASDTSANAIQSSIQNKLASLKASLTSGNTPATPQPNETVINFNGVGSGKGSGAGSSAAPSSGSTSSTPASTTASTTASSTPASTIRASIASKEGFTGANLNNGQSAPYSLTNYQPANTNSWTAPNLSIISGQAPSQGVQNILNRPQQPIPLPQDEMLMFANTQFKPDCCPSAFSTSTGCACITPGQYNYLIERGGNNVPYSEY